MKVVLVGHVCIDHNTSEGASYTSWGSPLLYINQYLMAQKINPLLIAYQGQDFAPYKDKHNFYPKKPVMKPTLVYENNSQGKIRRQRCFDSETTQPVPITKKVTKAVSQADLIIVAPLLPTLPSSYLQRLLKHRNKNSLTVLLPQGYLRQIGDNQIIEPRLFEEARNLAPLFDLTILSEEDVVLEDPASWGMRRLIITRSAEGAWVKTKKKDYPVACKALAPEKIIDSVGCGDTFAAALAYHYYQKHRLRKAVSYAHKIARRKLKSKPKKSGSHPRKQH